ncbi:vacuolar iron transporter homolog 2-like [Dioscorea cayenensis subsp. rotundata]|uniref:Vacuolar iron transporter n=1 Tax=Dioscorea cayennensis subsp. rotundata TaxID=55577 RepID=A0AB40BWH0_DIOCR|nr:vacuolar iron transporter homolog 2-like [Dioscorea cayenensis subsp. rotundata]
MPLSWGLELTDGGAVVWRRSAPHSKSVEVIVDAGLAGGAAIAVVNAAMWRRSVKIGRRAQWLRAAILGANDGLLSTTSLMLGVTAAKDDKWSVILSGMAGAIAGAFSMAVGEFVSVSTQRDIEMEMKSCNAMPLPSPVKSPVMKSMASVRDHDPPSPVKAATASGLAFIAGSLAPLLSGMFVSGHIERVAMLVGVSSVSLALFGILGAHRGRSPVRESAMRVLVGGWMAMAVTYWLLRPFHGKDADD